jgi:O-antigen ligase
VNASVGSPIRPQAYRLGAGVVLAAAAVVVGALVAVAPSIGLLAAGVVTLAGLVGRFGRVPIGVGAFGLALAVASLVDLPRQISLGPTTSYAWITALVALTVAAVALSGYSMPTVRATAHVFWPMYSFAALAGLSMVWFRPSFSGVQNVLVYIAFAGLLPVTAAAVIRGDLALAAASRAITATIVLASVLDAGNLAFGGGAVINNRGYALIGVVGVAWGVAHARSGDRRIALLAPLCWLLILLGLSRLAFAASLVVAVLGLVDVRTFGRAVKSLVVVGSISAVAFVLTTSVGPLAARFKFHGDQAKVHGVGVDLEGRSKLWRVTWDSYVGSPIVGRGAGSSERVIRQQLHKDSHPHNDYLRVLHDFGAVGLVVLLCGFLSMISHAVRAVQRTAARDPAAPIHLAAGLSLVGLLAGMSTDNAIIYLFVVTPIAALVGLSVGETYRRRWA